MTESAARRLFQLVEPVAVVTYMASEPTQTADPRRPRGHPGVARAADLVTKAGTSARTEGRSLYAGVRALPLPTEPAARLWHGANLLREHRGDGHVAALLTVGIGGTEAHVLHALSEGMPTENFGRGAADR